MSLKRKRNQAADLYEQVLEKEPAFESEEEPQPESESEAEEPQEQEKVLDVKALAKQKRKVDNSGVIYISRIPPGMGPAKVKHLMSQYGETGRVYLARDIKDTRKQNKNKKRHQSYRFVEGWVEFLDKKVARHVADLLNAKTIGGKASSAFCHDVWTLKYLPKFKWSMLASGLAQQRAKEAAVLRNEISQSKKVQASYLNQVEKSRVQKKIKEKREAAHAAKGDQGEATTQSNDKAGASNDSKEPKPKKARAFEQRQVVKRSKSSAGAASERALEGVLDNLF